MEAVVKADIFFFVTTIAVVMFTIFGIIIGVYVIRILREVEHMARVAREEVDSVVEDIQEISADVKDGISQVRASFSHGIGGIIALLYQTVMGARMQQQHREKKGGERRARAKKRVAE